MNSNSLVSISDISKEEIMRLLRQARYFEKHPITKFWRARGRDIIFRAVDPYAT